MGFFRSESMNLSTSGNRSFFILIYLMGVSVLGLSAAPRSHAAPQQRDKSSSSAPTKSKDYVKKTFQAKDGTTIDYWVMSPSHIEEGRKYPLVLALHGRGGNTTAATQLGLRERREEFPCYVIAPTSTKDGHWARPEGQNPRRKKQQNTKAMLPAALEAIDSFVSGNPVDTDRIYVTGQSMGGAGTFGAMALRPGFFAAAIPVAGGWSPTDANKMKDIAIWVFHGDDDKVVPTDYSRQMVEAIKQAGGSPKYTEYKGVGHDSWSQTYASDETWDWLFQQSLAK